MSRKERTERLQSGEEGIDYVVCQNCGQRLRSISNKHLSICWPGHNKIDYKTKYPDAQLICSDMQRIFRDQIDVSLPPEKRAEGRQTIKTLGISTAFDEQVREYLGGRRKITITAEYQKIAEVIHQKGLLTLNEVHQQTGIGKTTLYSALQTGRLAGELVEGVWGTTVQAVEEAIAAGKMKGKKGNGDATSDES